MNGALPTAEELERLPVRAVITYATRTARRISLGLRGIVADDIVDNALRLAEAVSTADIIAELEPASIILASERVVAAYAEAPNSLKSKDNFLILFSLAHVAMAAMHAILAAQYSGRARYQMGQVALEVKKTVDLIYVLGEKAAAIAREAARHDYDTLFREYGEHDEVVIGEPIDCFPGE